MCLLELNRRNKLPGGFASTKCSLGLGLDSDLDLDLKEVDLDLDLDSDLAIGGLVKSLLINFMLECKRSYKMFITRPHSIWSRPQLHNFLSASASQHLALASLFP